MPKRNPRPKTGAPIPPALAHKQARDANREVNKRNAQAPRGGHSPRPIRHQGR